MMCAQSGKTDGLILNTIGYYMSYYPAPIMIVQPTVNLGESFSKDRLAIYNDPLTYADLILNGDPEEYLKNVTASCGLED